MGKENIRYSGRKSDILYSHVKTQIFVDEFSGIERRQGTASWKIFDSALQDDYRSNYTFDGFFRATIPQGQGFKDYVETSLEDESGKAIGVEFGGLGRNLFAGFTEGFFARSAGVTLTEVKLGNERDNLPKNHNVIEGDLRDDSTLDAVDTWLNGQKADLIVERMVGALRHTPKDPYYLVKFIVNWYERLAGRGLMFIEIPRYLDILAKPWVKLLTEESEGSIDVSLKIGNPRHSRFRLKKLPGAPEQLPLLDPWIVKRKFSVARAQNKS